MKQPQDPALQNPFVGLRPYRSEESIYFFGRGEQTKRLMRLLHAHHFVTVVGSSGSGKSSLVRAGLIPQLEAGFLVQERDRWRIAIMKPGETPLCNLIRELAAISGERLADEDETQLLDQMQERGVQTLLDILTPLQENQDTNLLLLVDQFEELFRFALKHKDHRHQEQAEAFVAMLLRLSEQRQLSVFVCLTMRSDFLGDCDAFYGLPEAINRSQYLVPRLTRQQRREAIASPIHLAGAEIAPRLLDRLLNENVGTRDDLPILQHALMRTWTQWLGDDHGPIDLVHYDKIHTVKNALNVHADEALNELNEGDRVIAKRLFQTITETDAGNRRVRRPAHLSEIAAISDTTPQRVLDVIRKFREGDRNFLVLSSENPDEDPVVDISHESFIRQWKTLSRWVDEKAESVKIYRRLSEAASEWVHAGHDESYLYRGLQLEDAEKRMRSNEQLMDAVDQDFLKKSIDLQDRLVLKEKAREKALEEAREKAREKAWEKKFQLFRFYIGVSFVLLVWPIIFASILIYRGISMPDLEPWHTIPQLDDNLTQASYNDFSEYLAAESQFLATIQNGVTIEEPSSFNRYARNNKSSPYTYGENLNASFEFLPDEEEIKGGVLLVHGLADSPYHLRAIGRLFYDNGFYVIGLRLPGHGTVPGGLLNVTWEEWYSAVKFGARMVLEKIENRRDSKFYVGGFSTGGALTLRYFLEASSEKLKVLTVEKHRVPDKLLLLSPAIGVNSFAEIPGWHKIISWMPWFKKLKWLKIGPEYDPFKYTSFAENAGHQIYDLTKANQKLIEEIARNESIKEKLHPIYAFQSSVDATVKTDKLVDMYEKIASKESELFLFDINRLFEKFMNDDVENDNLLHSEKIKNMVAKVWLISNKPKAKGDGYEKSVAVKLVSELPVSDSSAEKEIGRSGELEWPGNVFALSHVCIPISPDDLYYGRYSMLGGIINLKGEKNVLLIADDFVRVQVRYNPFFQLIKERLVVSFLRSNEY
jgi:alpha-beta hydrolase superfamily lysophospholipase